MSKITSCKDCLFAKYENDTQVDCTLNKLNLFRKNYVVQEAYDEEKEFFIINRSCYWYRNSQWKYKTNTLQEQIEQLNKELQITYNIVIFYNDNIDNLQKTLQSLKTAILPPKHITVIRKITSNTKPSDLIHIIKPYNIPWRLQNNIHDRVTREEAIDLCIDIIHYNYYVVCDAGYEFLNSFMYTLNWKIFNQLYTFIGAVPDNSFPITILSYIVHKVNNGNAGEPLLQKIEYLKLPTVTEALNVSEN